MNMHVPSRGIYILLHEMDLQQSIQNVVSIFNNYRNNAFRCYTCSI